MNRTLKALAESLKTLSEYPDRSLIDYWRTIQGTPVGFHGAVGQGVPIAGPAALVSNDATRNPLMKPLLAKYRPNTFLGDAIRKKNCPVSIINFVENFVGKDEDEIKARFAKMEQRVANAITLAMRDGNSKGDEYGNFRRYVLDSEYKKLFYDPDSTWGKRKEIVINKNGETSEAPNWESVLAFSYDKEGREIIVPKLGWTDAPEIVEFAKEISKRIPQPENLVKPVTVEEMKKALAEKSDDYATRNGKIYRAITSNSLVDKIYGMRSYFDSPSDFAPSDFGGSSADFYQKDSNVVSALRTHFNSPSGQSSLIYQILKMEGVSGNLIEKDSGYGMSKEYIEDQLGTSYGEIKNVIGEMYVLNQIIMKAKGRETEQVSRAFGTSIPNLSQDESIKLLLEVANKEVPLRFSSRPVSGFSSGNFQFNGFGVSTEIPIEAALSSHDGVRVQANSFLSEAETLVIGASSIQFDSNEVGVSVGEGDPLISSKDLLEISRNPKSIFSFMDERDIYPEEWRRFIIRMTMYSQVLPPEFYTEIISKLKNSKFVDNLNKNYEQMEKEDFRKFALGQFADVAD
jgi:hypothetical protein